MPERAEDHDPAVRRDAHVAQHPDRKLRRVHGARHAHTGVERLLDTRLERNGLSLPARDVDAPELPLAPDHNRLAVGRPRVLRVETVNGPGLLQILVDVSEELPIAARLEIANVEKALQTHAAHVGERLAVGRDLRRDRSALHADGAALAAGRQIPADDRVDRPVGILVVFERLPGRDVLAVIERAAIGRNVRLARVFLPSNALGDLQPVARSRGVIHPDLAGAKRSLLDEVPPRIDVGPIRRPCRAVHEPAPLARDLPGILPVQIDRPDVPEPIAVAGHRDALAVRTEPRLHLEGRAARQAPGWRRAAGNRDEIDVTQQVEHHLRAVGAHVDVHPCALARIERQRGRRTGGIRDLPFLRFRLAVLTGMAGDDAARHQGERDQALAVHLLSSLEDHATSKRPDILRG